MANKMLCKTPCTVWWKTALNRRCFDAMTKCCRSSFAQADALMIEARAKMRLADEYDAAQDRGEVATVGQRSNVVGDNVSTAADLGLRRDEIHEARKLRDAERQSPGLICAAWTYPQAGKSGRLFSIFSISFFWGDKTMKKKGKSGQR